MESKNITFYFVRHAQTCANEKFVNGDAQQDVLTDLGRIQTNLLGMHLSAVKFDRAFSSDYTRAIQTAQGILNYSKVSREIQIDISPQLKEVDLGVFENRPYNEIMDYCKNLKEDVHDWSFPEGESFPEAGKRFLNFVENTCDQHYSSSAENKPATILVVSHSAILTCFITALINNEHHEIVGLDQQDRKLMNNTCYMKIKVAKKGSKQTLKLSSETVKNELRFEVEDAYYSSHLGCLKGLDVLSKMRRGNNPILDFAKGNKDGRRFLNCVQQ